MKIFKKSAYYYLEQERIKLLSCMEPLPEQASAGSVAWLQPERLLKQTILHISPTDLGFVMVLSSSSRYLHASRALEIPFPYGPCSQGPLLIVRAESEVAPSSQFDAGYQITGHLGIPEANGKREYPKHLWEED